MIASREVTNLSEETATLPRHRMLELVQSILARNSVARPPSIDEELGKAGLSSIDMVNLMLAVEAEFDVSIPAAEITPANFRSIATIEALILKLAPPAASG